MVKSERRASKRFRQRYGQSGSGASHTREAHESEVRRHFQKFKRRKKS